MNLANWWVIVVPVVVAAFVAFLIYLDGGEPSDGWWRW